jgi:hypothetical protein
VSHSIGQPSRSELFSNWEEYTKQNNVDRKIRHIITGNLLQAFSDFKGKLVSYTTLNGETKKGILMPEHWDPTDQVQDRVSVPIIKALPIIKSITQGNHITVSNGLSFFRQGDYYKLIIASSRSRGGDIYLDEDILSLVEKHNFEKVSDKMVGMLAIEKIDKLVEVLQTNHSLSVTIQSYQMKDLNNDIARYKNRKRIELPDDEEKMPEITQGEQADDLNLLELEAEAIALELELLSAA